MPDRDVNPETGAPWTPRELADQERRAMDELVRLTAEMGLYDDEDPS